MPTDKINVSGDSRIQYRSANVNGKQYGYLYSQPESGQYRATIFLLHGFPDLSMGWRYQIPMLADMELRVIAPDCLGYGRTDAPEDVSLYSHKQCANDIKELAHQLGSEKIILGGHDWGASLAYRVALWHPELVSHLFTVCVPYAGPTTTYIPLEELVKSITPHFGYQLQFASGDVEKIVRTKDEIKGFLKAMYGGRTETGELGLDVKKGVALDKLSRLQRTRLLSEKELDYYGNEFSRNGVRGPLNWYRTRETNHTEEQAILNQRITIPVLFIQALRDPALPPHLGKRMAKTVPRLSRKQVDASHWALWEKPEEVNSILKTWIKEIVFEERAAKL